MIIRLFILEKDNKYVEYVYPEDCYDIAVCDMDNLTKEGIYCFIFASVEELADVVNEELLSEEPCLC